MFPFVFEWAWGIDRLVFMGGLWYALSIIGMGVGYCIVKSVIDTLQKKEDGGHGHH